MPAAADLGEPAAALAAARSAVEGRLHGNQPLLPTRGELHCGPPELHCALPPQLAPQLDAAAECCVAAPAERRRVTVVCVDARRPLLHFPAHAVQSRRAAGEHVLIVLTKSDVSAVRFDPPAFRPRIAESVEASDVTTEG